MESGLTWESEALINELTQGMEKAKQLRFHLSSSSPGEEPNMLLQRVLSSYEKALLILQWNGSVEQAQPTVGAPKSSVTIDGSPKSEEVNKNFEVRQKQRDTPKKRKLQPTWTEQVRVHPINGLEGPKEDRYSWRKYGKKDILGTKYPRSYYRCTYRHIQNCWATKQVQRDDNDPTIFEITYKGTHMCHMSKNAVLPQASSEKQEMEHNSSHNHQTQQHNQTLVNLKANLRVNTEDLEIPAQFSPPPTFACPDTENYYFPMSGLVDDNQLGTFSSLFYSPDTPESNYFPAETYQMWNYKEAPNMQHSKTDVAEIISTHASTTNSPIGSMEFLVDTADLDPNFPFNNRGFFT